MFLLVIKGSNKNVKSIITQRRVKFVRYAAKRFVRSLRLFALSQRAQVGQPIKMVKFQRKVHAAYVNLPSEVTAFPRAVPQTSIPGIRFLRARIKRLVSRHLCTRRNHRPEKTTLSMSNTILNITLIEVAILKQIAPKAV